MPPPQVDRSKLASWLLAASIKAPVYGAGRGGFSPELPQLSPHPFVKSDPRPIHDVDNPFESIRGRPTVGPVTASSRPHAIYEGDERLYVPKRPEVSLVSTVPGWKPPPGTPLPDPGPSLLVARIVLGPNHFLEFHRAFQGPDGFAVVEIGSNDVAPTDRLGPSGTEWHRLSGQALYRELTGGELPFKDLQRAAPRLLPDLQYDDWRITTLVAAEPYPDLDAGVNRAIKAQAWLAGSAQDALAAFGKGLLIGDGVYVPSGVSAYSAERSAANWEALFCQATGYTDPDSLWWVVNEANVEAGAAHTLYFEAAAKAVRGSARFEVEHFDYASEAWVPAYTRTLASGWWAIYSRLADPPGTSRVESGSAVGGSEELSYRSRVRGAAVHFVQKYRRVPTYLTNAGKFPRDWGGDFANAIQGVTHDEAWWYLSRTNYSFWSGDPVSGELARVHVDRDLSKEAEWAPRDYDPSRPLVDSDANQAAEPEPPEWSREGFVHYGDLSFANEHLFVAIEGTGESRKCGIGVFSKTLKPVGLAELSQSGNCAWVVFNPRDGLFYTTSPENSDPFLVPFQVRTGVVADSIPGPALSIPIRRRPEVGLQKPVGVQGGAFSERGTLWLVTNGQPRLVAVDLPTGFVYERARVDVSDFDNWEGEGVTIWDLTMHSDHRVRGHLHLQVLDNDNYSDSNLTFWHLLANDPKAL